MDLKAKDIIQRARVRMYSTQPFYAFLACGLKLREVPDIPTMATDGEHLFYNPEYVKSLDKTAQTEHLWHESDHVFKKHPLRMAEVCGCLSKHTSNGVEPHTCYWKIAQVAADYAVNPYGKDAGMTLDNAIFPDQEHWHDSFEGHFKRLKESAKTCKIPATAGCSGCQPPKGKGGQPLTQSEKDALDRKLTQRIIQAANVARQMGKLPADVERYLDGMLQPIISWKEVLRRFINQISKDDYRMLPPNRRFIWQGMYLPSLRSETVGQVLVICDGSGSTMNEFPQFVRETSSIICDVKPEWTHFMVWDTRCSWYKAFEHYSEEDERSIAAMGQYMGAGGGSVFTDCFDWFNRETGIRPAVAVVLTDGYIGWPVDPGFPVLWAINTDQNAPWGEQTKIEV